MIYQASVRSNNSTKNYFGLSETDFKLNITTMCTLSETDQNTKLLNSPNLYGNAKMQDQSLPSTGNRFVVHHCTSKEMTTATFARQKNLQFSAHPKTMLN